LLIEERWRSFTQTIDLHSPIDNQQITNHQLLDLSVDVAPSLP